ncbi:(2Fe-2S)-binding protein [Sphaerisporangium sp. NPDC088356]|uniref:(2Fe-2S)-binding protein n=1 Tax=Sphaerisporangium sp. NPDC088356 TaxID=3154871 RepID=UPI0034270628
MGGGRGGPGVVADPGLVVTALADVSAIGPYFAVCTEPGCDDAPSWRPLGELSSDIGALRARVADFERRLGTGESRVAASILFQGLAARLWSPVVGAATAHRLVPVHASAHMRWRAAPTGPLPLWTPRTAGWATVRQAECAEVVYQAVVAELLDPLVEAFQQVTKIAPSLLWGNAASALAGTLRTLPAARPDLGPPAARLVGEVLRLGVLAGTGEPAEPAPGHHFFVRTSCCLYYRVPGGGMCDDCALLTPAIREAQWARTVRQAGGAL